MPVPADLSALIRRALKPCLVAALLSAPLTGADAPPKPPPKPQPRPAPAAPAAKPPPVIAQAETSALTTQGQRVTGEPRFSAGSVVLGAATIAIGSLIALDFPGERPRWLDQGVVLADGQVLRGVPRTLQQEQLDFASDLIGVRTLPLADVAAIVFATLPCADPLVGISGFTGAVLANGDRIAGSVSFINERDVGIDTGRKLAQIPRARVKVLCLRAATPATGLWLRTAAGDRVRGVAVAEGFAAQIGAGDPLKLPLAALRAAWNESPQLMPLERLKPATITRSPQFDEDFPVTIDRFHDGAPLAIGERQIERGISCHSGCELVWTDLAAYASLVGEAGVADGPGIAVCRVVVDGKVAFDSGPLAGGATPRPFAVSVSGAHEVRLVADPGPGGDTAGDRVVWAWPTLVK